MTPPPERASGGLSADELRLASRALAGGLRHSDISVPGIMCGGCIRKIEGAVGALPGVVRARVNLSTKRVAVDWRDADGPPALGAALEKLGYQAFLQESTVSDGRDPEFGRLVRALAVAGFAMMNIMAFSISIWAGAAGGYRDLFHWISAAIAFPTLLYSGRVFFRSAWNALRHGETNMDVPISIGVLLAFGMSLYDTIDHQPHAYFDAAVSLLFFLLIGRTLDHMMREKARTAVKGLGKLAARGATVVAPDGTRSFVPTADITPGMTVLVAAGARIPVDSVVLEGRSDLDVSLATGESAPEPVQPGSVLRAGTLNLTGPLTVAATATADDSFLAEIIRLMEAAEGGRSHYRRIADRAAALYVPVVHGAALLAFAGWLVASGDWHQALTIAVAVLIITCPCALGLAVPMVQVVAARALFERGIMVKDGTALERLAGADMVVFDKTGTLTLGQPELDAQTLDGADREALAIAARMAAGSRHPYAEAIANAVPAPVSAEGPAVENIAERAGLGIEATCGGARWRLGRARWALDRAPEAASITGTVLSRDGRLVQAFRYHDTLRPGAQATVRGLQQARIPVGILSGDTAETVADVGAALSVPADSIRSELLPAEKAEALAGLAQMGTRVLMVGDGLNDAPALAAAYVSMAPGTAADIGRQAADLVFLHPGLEAVPQALGIARRAARLVRQNFTFAVLYNMVALPLAIAGFVTPLVAALAMSFSSVTVVGNALRLDRGRRNARERRDAGGARPGPAPTRATRTVTGHVAEHPA